MTDDRNNELRSRADVAEAVSALYAAVTERTATPLLTVELHDPCPYGSGDHGPLIQQARDEERARIAAEIEAELWLVDDLDPLNSAANDGLHLAAWIARHSHEADHD